MIHDLLTFEQPPALDHDAMMKERFGTVVHATGRNERRIIYNLGKYLELNGFHVSSVWDGEEGSEVNSIKEAMELIFNLDEAHLYVKKPGGKVHRIYFILGNGNDGNDIITDYTYSDGDVDGFEAVMNNFDAEEVTSTENVETCLLTDQARLMRTITEKVDHATAMGDITTAFDMLNQIRILVNS